MQARVAEFHMRAGALSPKKKLRVDLHGVSVFGRRGDHTLIRWEWITGMDAGHGLVIRSHNSEIRFPEGAFRRSSEELARLLEAARSIERRGEIIGRLASGT